MTPPPAQRWRLVASGLTDGRFVIEHDSPERLRDLGVPAFYPYALYDTVRGKRVYVKHFPNEPQAQRYAQPDLPPTLPKPKGQP